MIKHEVVDRVFLDRLLGLALEAGKQVEPLNPRLAMEWRRRAEEFKLGIVDRVETRDWLLSHAEHWKTKDSKYAAYVHAFAASYKPVIEVGATPIP